MKILMIGKVLVAVAAASEYPFLRPLVLLKNMIVTSVALVGTIWVVKNLTEFFASMNAKDNSGMWDAGQRVLGSLAIAAIGWILTFLGIE